MQFNIDTVIFIVSGFLVLSIIIPIVISQREKIAAWSKKHLHD